jgi:hypothetical protein
MSQQRPARRLPSLLVDPAEETVRRRCRDPINVESLLVSAGPDGRAGVPPLAGDRRRAGCGRHVPRARLSRLLAALAGGRLPGSALAADPGVPLHLPCVLVCLLPVLLQNCSRLKPGRAPLHKVSLALFDREERKGIISLLPSKCCVLVVPRALDEAILFQLHPCLSASLLVSSNN